MPMLNLKIEIKRKVYNKRCIIFFIKNVMHKFYLFIYIVVFFCTSSQVVILFALVRYLLMLFSLRLYILYIFFVVETCSHGKYVFNFFYYISIYVKYIYIITKMMSGEQNRRIVQSTEIILLWYDDFYRDWVRL